MDAVYGWRRVLADCGRQLVDLRLALQQLRAVKHAYIRTWGDHALVPLRGKPIPLACVLALIATLQDQASTLGWPPVQMLMWIVIICFINSSGTRTNEWTEAFKGDTFLRRSNFTPFKDGAPAEPTPELYRVVWCH